jgi:hypothetical protein
MAQDILITPGSGEPQILFRGSGTNDTPIELNVLSSYQSANGSGSALLFEGTEGQLFAITDNLSSGVIFSVAGAAGLPFIEADASGDVRLIEYGRYVGVGTGTPAYQLDVFGTGRFSEGILFADGSVQTGAYTGDGGGGGSTPTGTASGVAFFGGDNNLTESTKFIFDSGNGRLGVGPGVSASDFVSNNIVRITNSKVIGGANAFNSTLTVENGDSHGINIISATNRGGNIYFSDTAANRGQMGYQHNTDFMYFYTSATERVRIDSAGNVSIGDTGNNGQLYIVNDTASDIGLTVQGAVSQSANLQEWQDSSQNVLSLINPNGEYVSTGLRIYSNSEQYSSGDYEYVDLKFNGSEFQLDTSAGGTGTVRNLKTNTTAILLNANSEIQNNLDFDCRSRFASFQDGTNHITLSPTQQATFFNGSTYRWVSQSKANRGGTSGDTTRMTLDTSTTVPTLKLGLGSIAGVDGGYQVVGNGSNGSRNYLFAGQWTAGENDSVYYSNLSGNQTDTCDHASYETLGILVFNVDYTGNISGNSIQFRDGTTQTTASIPGGSDTNIQFNNGGTFSGESNFTWDYNTDLLTVSGTSLMAGTGVVFEVQNTGGTTLFAVEDTSETTVVVNSQVGQTSYPFEVRDEFGITAAYVDVSGNISGNNISFGDGTTQTTAAGPASVISDSNTGITVVCATHANSYLRTTSNSGVTITFPSGLGCDANSEFTFEQAGSGQITVTGDAGVTINTSSTTKTYTQFSVISMKQVATDTYTLFGDTASF